MIRTTALLAATVALLGATPGVAFAQRKVPIPRSTPGDGGRYFLLEAKGSGDVVRTPHTRVDAFGTGYTRMEVNCRTMLVREVGYSEGSPAAIRKNPTKWFDLVSGSSKSDIANFVCRRRR